MMTAIRGNRRGERLFIFTTLFIWAWINICVALRYEPWRDIAQSWMIARELSLPELFAQLKYEGHPCLWFLLLMPMAKLGAPFGSIIGLSFALTLAALWLFLREARLPRLARLCVVFSSMGLYYMPVCARSYALVPLLLMLLYKCYPTRIERPVRYACVLFLLCQTHVLLCGFCGMLMLQWGIDAIISARAKRRLPGASVAAALIMAGAVGFLVWQLAGSIQTNQVVSLQVGESASSVRHALLNALNMSGWYLTTIHFYERGNTFWWLALAPLLLTGAAVALCWLRRAPRSALLIAAAFGWQLFIHAFLYGVHMHHILTFMWILLFCVLLARDELPARAGHSRAPERAQARSALLGKALLAGLMGLCILTCAQVYPAMRDQCSNEGINSFAGAVADTIRELPEGAVVICDSEDYASPVAAYSEKGRLYNPARDNMRLFALHDSYSKSWCGAGGSFTGAVERLRDEWGVTGELYFLCAPDVGEAALRTAEADGLALEPVRYYVAERAYENYHLYRVIEAER